MIKNKFSSYKPNKVSTQNIKRKRKTRAQYWEDYLKSKKNPDRKKYFVFFSKSKNNLFLTITNVRGEVIVSKSAGDCKIKSKKKKKSWDTLKEISSFTAKTARLKNIKYVYKFFTYNSYLKNSKIIFKAFKDQGLIILKTVLLRSRPFSIPMRKKKAKRL